MWQKFDVQSIEVHARTPGCAALYSDLQKLIRHVVNTRHEAASPSPDRSKYLNEEVDLMNNSTTTKHSE